MHDFIVAAVVIMTTRWRRWLWNAKFLPRWPSHVEDDREIKPARKCAMMSLKFEPKLWSGMQLSDVVQ